MKDSKRVSTIRFLLLIAALALIYIISKQLNDKPRFFVYAITTIIVLNVNIKDTK